MTTAIPDSVRDAARRMRCPDCMGEVAEAFLDPTDGAWQLNIQHYEDCPAMRGVVDLSAAQDLAARNAGLQRKESSS